MEKFLHASQKSAEFLASKISADGSLIDANVNGDLCSQCKLPMLFMLSGHSVEAHRILDYMKSKFMQLNGDFISYPLKLGKEKKSDIVPMQHFWSYMNTWLAMGAHRLGRFDISVPAFKFCKTFYNPNLKAVCVTEPFAEITDESTVDCLSTAQFGLLCLYMGDVKLAEKCGEGLLNIMAAQPNLDKHLYLRMSAKTGSIITNSPPNLKKFYMIKKDTPKQLYFCLGYHGMFLTKLYQATGNQQFLESAKAILEFALMCHEDICTCSFSHTVAYAAALIAVETKEAKYRRFAIGLGEYLITIQNKQGFFCGDFEAVIKYDQTAEIAIWLKELTNELKKLVST